MQLVLQQENNTTKLEEKQLERKTIAYSKPLLIVQVCVNSNVKEMIMFCN